jgi:membrane protein YdbS with pleckstrin-like domain
MSQQSPQNPLQDNIPHRETGDTEEVYYQGSPMVRGAIGKIFFWALLGIVLIAAPLLFKMFQKDHEWPVWWLTLGLIVLGLIALVIPILIVKSVRYRISNYRIDYERGILGKRIDTLELWHVEDIRFEQSFVDRLLGVGNLTVISHDDTTPKLTMNGIPNPRPRGETRKQRGNAGHPPRGGDKMDNGGHGAHGDISST